MDGLIQLNGVLGILILLATVSLLVLIAFVCISAIGYIKVRGRAVPVLLKSWLLASVILLLFDGAYYVSLEKTFTRETGSLLDQRMIAFWIPAHVVAFFLVQFAFRRFSKKRWI